ncbi:cation diffusion facilitator family transporter [Enterococcus raffinosus]|jgi:cation diffusion facilitator family transporter|uniref:Cation diffusion facilitator family transporter n=1 Tax=Enterococcus raffinosus TaxID=71452 RepID=A0AAW8SWC9_9ENTE|nr:cation diffusion facilitator family transporter [Enterococcus raffinosus]MBS6430949.1 cation transporter [Enterococcus raffinosus]MDK7990264.1 cation diffusion facilitator family transporter [Enterococcus raffinosus]MDT2536864.1 cation diffusion facilitator family transporter [Enterococcus raffinosus]MDT2573574.1 cation diffusion facilitator family transporter [Enterococcus raffinosus]OJG83804.1 cation diffusion facilitator family transporter [Enterococcus raffinosus]
MVNNRYEQLKKAELGAIISIAAYILVSAMKLIVGNMANSEALRADGLNNFTDILASVAVLIGLRISQKPADAEHRYGHWKAENVASLVTSFIMLLVGLQVLYSSILSVINKKMESPDITAAIVGLVSAVIMYGVYFFNKRLSEEVKSPGLLAAAKDNRSDAWTSIGTAIAVFAASFNLGWLDSVAAIVVALLILKTAIDIFKESVFTLSDGFDQEELDQFNEAIRHIQQVQSVKNIKGRSYGSNIYLDVTVTMRPELTVKESHDVADQIENLLRDKFQVFETDVHVEPSE